MTLMSDAAINGVTIESGAGTQTGFRSCYLGHCRCSGPKAGGSYREAVTYYTNDSNIITASVVVIIEEAWAVLTNTALLASVKLDITCPFFDFLTAHRLDVLLCVLAVCMS